MKNEDMEAKQFQRFLGWYKEVAPWGWQKLAALELGVKESHISMVVSGSKLLKKRSTRERFAAALKSDLSYDAMVKKGAELLQEGAKIPQPEHPLIVQANNERARDYVAEHAEYYRGVPLYKSGKLAARVGGLTFDESEDPESTVVIYQAEIEGRSRHDLRALRVGGDSMWPVIPEGSIVIVDLNDTELVPNKIYVVREPDSDPPIATVKRIRKAEQKRFKGFALVSENRKYLPEMTDLDWPELVVGRVVWMWRSLEEA